MPYPQDNGLVRCWGFNSYGQLGDGTTTDRTTPTSTLQIGSGREITAVSSALLGHTCVIVADGFVSCWGYNYRGQIGDGTTTDKTAPANFEFRHRKNCTNC